MLESPILGNALSTFKDNKTGTPSPLPIISLPYRLPSWYFSFCYVTFGWLNRGVGDSHHRERRRSGRREERKDRRSRKQRRRGVERDTGRELTDRERAEAKEGRKARDRELSYPPLSQRSAVFQMSLFKRRRSVHINWNGVSLSGLLLGHSHPAHSPQAYSATPPHTQPNPKVSPALQIDVSLVLNQRIYFSFFPGSCAVGNVAMIFEKEVRKINNKSRHSVNLENWKCSSPDPAEFYLFVFFH